MYLREDLCGYGPDRHFSAVDLPSDDRAEGEDGFSLYAAGRKRNTIREKYTARHVEGFAKITAPVIGTRFYDEVLCRKEV